MRLGGNVAGESSRLSRHETGQGRMQYTTPNVGEADVHEGSGSNS